MERAGDSLTTWVVDGRHLLLTKRPYILCEDIPWVGSDPELACENSPGVSDEAAGVTPSCRRPSTVHGRRACRTQSSSPFKFLPTGCATVGTTIAPGVRQIDKRSFR